MTEERRNEIRLGLKKDLILFGKVVMPQSFCKESPPFHYELAELYHDKNEKLVNIIAPRHHAKSTVLAEAAPLHHLMYDPGKKVIMIVSKTLGHSQDRLQAIKDILEFGNEFRELFGYWGKDSARKWTETEIELKDGSSILCKGTGQQIVGKKKGAQRPTYVVLDDPEDENNTKTKEAMEHNWRILLKGIMPGVDSDKGRIFIIGTPQNELCMVERVKTMPSWTTKEYDAYLDEEKEIALWPQVMPWKKLKNLEEDYRVAGSISVFYSEYRCQIVGDEDQTFKKEYLKFWDGYLEIRKVSGIDESFIHITHEKYTYMGDWVKLKEEKIVPTNNFIGIDPASSLRLGADFSVTFPVGYSAKKEIYCLPYWRKRETPFGVANGIIEKIKETRPKRGGIETTGYQEMLRQEVRKRMLEEDCYVPGFEQSEGYKPRTEKNERLLRLHPFFYRREVWVHKDMKAFVDELLMFPRGKHDDCMDGFDYATKKLYAPTHTTETDKKDDLSYFLTSSDSERSWMGRYV